MRRLVKVILILLAVVFMVNGTFSNVEAGFCDEPDVTGKLPDICSP